MGPTAPNKPWHCVTAALAAVTLLAGGIAAATLLSSGIASAESRPGSFSVQPAHFDPSDPATRAYFKPVLVPGSSFHDQVIVGNNSNEPIDFVISAVDGLTGTTSGAVYANREDPIHKAGSWIQPEIASLTVAPNK